MTTPRRLRVARLSPVVVRTTEKLTLDEIEALAFRARRAFAPRRVVLITDPRIRIDQ